jgi:tetratricopeptide (TPR) repeat protein
MTRPPPDDSDDEPLDPAELDKLVATLRQAIESPVDPEALAEAQEIMYDAWEADSAERAVALAMKAIGASPHCCDAYVLLGSIAPAESDDALAMFGLAVEAGERALGAAALADPSGEVWQTEEAGPYLRARLGLAQSLWLRGQHDAAIGHYQNLLELDPDDRQGVRHVLAAALLELDRDDELAALLESYSDDEGAEWTYTRLLAGLRAQADAPTLARLLRDAVASNALVPDFLLGNTPMPDDLPEDIEVGGPDEAAAYAEIFGAGWIRTKGALAWLGREWPKVKPAD